MKKILSVVYDDILADPRASKFKKTLLSSYSLHTLSVEVIDAKRENNDITFKCTGGKYAKLFKFWINIFKIYRKLRPDIVLAHNYYVAFPCFLLSKLYGTKLVYDAYELYVPEKKQKFSFRYYLFYFLERVAIKNADLVFSANIERSRLMKKAYKLDVTPTPILNIPIIDNQNIDTVKSDKFTIVYEGAITFNRHLKKLVDAIEFLPEDFMVTFIGDGPDFDHLKAIVAEHPHKNRINCLGRVKNTEILPLLSKCHLGFVGYPMEGLNNIYCSPNKIYEYPAAGLPFISTNQSPICTITGDYHICEYYNPNRDSIQDIANLIIKIANNYSYYTELISKFNTEHSWEVEAIKIEEVIRQI